MKLSAQEKTDLARITWEKLLEADAAPDPLAPDEMTAAMYAAETHKSQGWCSNRLLLRWRNGELTRRKYGIHSWAYRVKHE